MEGPPLKRRRRNLSLTLSKKSKSYRLKRKLEVEAGKAQYYNIQDENISMDSRVTSKVYSATSITRRDIGIQCDNIDNGPADNQTNVINVPQFKLELQLIATIMPAFLKQFSKYGLIKKFLTFLTVIADGLLLPNNLAVLCLLDRAQYAACTSTTNMLYHPETLQFWTSIYLLFGNSALSVFKGFGNFGQVIKEQSTRGRYDPKESRTNFAVPSGQTIRKINMGYPSHLKPGFIQQTLDIAQKLSAEGIQFVLSMDGKKCSRGLGKDLFAGDIYLFGAEKPNLRNTLEMHEKDCAVVKNVTLRLTAENKNIQWFRLRHMLHVISRRIKRLRIKVGSLCTDRKRNIRLSHNNPDNDKRYQFGLSRINAAIVTIQNMVKRALVATDEITMLIRKLFNSYSGLKPVPLDISTLPNFHGLLPVEYVSIFLDLNESPEFMKRTSVTCLNMRAQSILNESQLFPFLGFQTLKDQKQVMQELHSTKNVCNEAHWLQVNEMQPKAIATLLTSIIFALCPPCHTFLESGLMFKDGNKRKKLFEYSPSGIIQCTYGDNCEYKSLHRTRNGKILVHFDFPAQEDQFPSMPRYEIWEERIPLYVFSMYFCDAEELWLISCTNHSCTLQIALEDSRFAESMYNFVAVNLDKDKYDKDVSNLHLLSDLRTQLNNFKQRNCTFMYELPTCPAFEGQLNTGELISPYSSVTPPANIPVCLQDIRDEIASCSITSLDILQESFQLLRQQASEVLVWMLQDKDRIHNDTRPGNLPVAFALRGQSVSTKDLLYMTKVLRDELKRRNINILTEVYDGEWKGLMLKTSSGFPLTKLQLAKLTWSKASTLGKEKCMKQMLDTCTIHSADVDLLRSSQIEKDTTVVFGNLTVRRLPNGNFLIHSNGGQEFKTCVADKFVTDRHITFQSPISKSNQSSGNEKHQYGLKADESSLIDVINGQFITSPPPTRSVDLVEDEDYLPDLEPLPTALHATLHNPEFKLLSDILTALCDFDLGKWLNEKEDDIFPDLLQNGRALYKKCTVKELQIVGGVLTKYTGRKWYNSGEDKGWNVNSITSAFGCKKTVPSKSRPKRKEKSYLRQPQSLVARCKSIILRKEYPLETLQVAYANVLHCKHLDTWRNNCKVKMTARIPIVEAEMDLYSYPEFNDERQQVEFRTYDNTHSLTRIRRHMCTTGYDFAKKEAFRLVADERPDILSRAIVYDMVDGQNAFTAMRFFDEKVEGFMLEHDHVETAQFVRLIRNYHKACDQRGISADYRVLAFYELHKFLSDGIDFNKFPFPFMGQYIRGMPWQTFEALMQNCSTRIQLYEFATGKHYNARAPTTLNCESQFSDLCRMDKSGSMYPKAANVCKLFWKVVTMNHIKHRPDKSFFLCTLTRGTYPVHLSLNSRIELEEEDEYAHEGLYRNNFFDHLDTHTATHYRRSDITTGNAPLRCVPSTRTWFRCNEDRVLSETLSRLRPAGTDENLVEI